MPYDYNDIVRQFYEELKPLFINFLRNRYIISYDDIMDIYNNVWEDVHKNIRKGMVAPGTRWKAYIFQMGENQACKFKKRHVQKYDSIDDEQFNLEEFEKQCNDQREDEGSIYEDPDLQAVLGAELSYIPDPCNKILKLYYYDKLSMREISDAMNYKSANSAKTIKNRCLEKLKRRVLDAVRLLGIID